MRNDMQSKFLTSFAAIPEMVVRKPANTENDLRLNFAIKGIS